MSVMRIPTGSTKIDDIDIVYAETTYDLFIYFIASLIAWRFLLYI
tara:strand:+ start:609 stop:743 length:135 start_codon:yes stop_codon:yes gene_type:complete